MVQDSQIPGHLRRHLKVVSLPDSKNLFTSYGNPGVNAMPKEDNPFSSDSFTKAADDILERLEESQQQSLTIAKGGEGLGNTRRALERVRSGAPIAFYDIENLGQPRTGQPYQSGDPLFGLTQFSFGVEHDGQTDVRNIVFGQTEEDTSALKKVIDQLEADYTTYYELDDRTRGSLADLATFSDRSLFGESTIIGGKTYRTLPGQAEPLTDSLTGLTSKQSIQKMRQGLENLSDPDLVSQPESIVDLVSHLEEQKFVLGGHNVERHDQPALLQQLNRFNAPEHVKEYAANSQVDTLRMAENILNRDGTPKVRNNRLSTLYESITDQPFGEGQAHNAGFDVQMNMAIFESLNEHSEQIVSGNRTIQPNQEFAVQRGVNFSPSGFTQNNGQFDMVTVIDPETGKHKLQYDNFRQGTGRGRTLQFDSALEPMDIDGVRHYGVRFYNSEEDKYHHFFRTSQSGIDDLFEDYLVDIDSMSEDEIGYIEKDNVRRHYNEFFTRPARNAHDTVTKRLDDAYDILDVYDREATKLREEGVKDGFEESVLENTIESVNRNRGDYKYGRRRIENTIALRDRLRSEEELWREKVGPAARGVAGAGENPMAQTQRENLYYRNIFSTFSDATPETDYGHSNLEVLKLPNVSNPGEVTHPNVQSRGQIQALVRNELKKDMDRAGRGKTGVHFQNLMNTVGVDLDDKQYNDMKRLVDRDLKRGEVSAGTIDQVANEIYKKKELLKRDGVVVNSLPGFDIEKPFAMDVLQNGSDLTGKTPDEMFQNLMDQTAETVDHRIARGSNKPFRQTKSRDVVNRFKKSNEVQHELRERVVATNDVLGLKKGEADIFKSESAEERAAKVMESFHANGFQVKLEQVDGSDRVLLFATPDKNMNLTEMNAAQLEASERVFQAPLPLYNDNMSVDTPAGEMRDVQHLRLKSNANVNNLTANDVYVESTSNALFSNMSYSSKNIKDALERGESLEDAIGSAQSNYYTRATELGIPSGYRSESAKDLGFTSASREANRHLMINTNDYLEEYARVNYSNVYQRYLEGKESGGSDSILDYFSRGQRSKFRIEATNEFNQRVGDVSGVHLFSEALNPNQSGRGLMNLMPGSLALPFAQMHSPIREQANKTLNYRLVDREPLERYFESIHGEDSLASKISIDPAQLRGQNRLPREQGVRAYELSTLQVGNEALAEASEQVRQEFREELDILMDRKDKEGITQQDSERITQLRSHINMLDSGFISTFEDEFLMDEELLRSISSSEQLDLDLDGYELHDKMEGYLKRYLDTEKLPTGRIDIEGGLTVKDMQDLGIVNEDSMLTVGKLAQDVIADQSGVEYSEAKKRRIQKGAILNGVTIDEDGKAILHLNNRYVGGSGNKTLRAASGARETSIGIHREILSRLGNKITGRDVDIQAISSFEKMGPGGRRSTGSAYTDLITTSAYNVSGAIDRLHKGEKSGLGVVDDFFADRELGESPMESYHSFMENRFVKDINSALGSEQIAYLPDATQPFEYVSTGLTGTSKERQGHLNNLFELSSNDYGVDIQEDYGLVRAGYLQHNISYWQGTNSKAKYGQVELSMLNQITSGSTPEDVADIRELGTVDGIDFSGYEGFRKEDSLVMRNLNHLSQTTNDPQEIAEYTRSLDSARRFQKNGRLEDVQGDGNIIIDIAGEYSFDEDSNFLTFGEGDDQYTVVDGSRIGTVPKGRNATGAELKNTYGNLYSVDLYGEDVEITIGDLVEEQNAKVYAKLVDPDHPLAGDSQLENEVVEVVPLLKSKRQKAGEVFLEESERQQMYAFEAAYELAHGPQGDVDDSRKWAGRRIQRIEDSLNSFMSSSGKYIGSDASRNASAIQENNSFAFGMQGRNFLSSDYGVDDFVFNERQAKTLIQGREQTILDANLVDDDALSEFFNMNVDDFNRLDDTERSGLQQEYIIDRLTRAKADDDDFEMLIALNRQPTQNEGSFVFGSLRVDNTMGIDDNSGSVDPRIAGYLGGDNDGDIPYATSYPYLKNMSPEEARQLQLEMQDLRQYSVGKALVANDENMREDIAKESKSPLIEIMGLTDESEVANIFSDNLTEANAMLQIMSDEIMGQNVGAIYNTVVANREAINMFSDHMTSNTDDNIVMEQMRRLTQGSTDVMEQIQQSAISRKKITPSQIADFAGLDPEYGTNEGFQKLHEEGRLTDILTQFDEARSALPSDMRDIRTDSVPQFMKDLEVLDIMSFDDNNHREQVQETLTGMAQVNEAMAGTTLGGFDNPYLRIGFSTADDNRLNFADTLRENPSQVPVTPDTEGLASMLFADEPDVIENWRDTQSGVMENVQENFQRIQNRELDDMVNQGHTKELVQQLSNARWADTAGDRIRSQSGLYNQMKDGVSSIGKSTAFRAAAGVTAAWTVARALRSGPTPEGNEAEQEMATAEEVAPSQLLTSPTARVTPNAQGLNLNVQASGNLSEQEVAGLINQEIAAMTGQPMEMNINVNDNTAKLDNRFYQRAVDRSLGF